MKSKVRVVYNRADCPYDCGMPLPANLRWQGTPCQRCGRPLYPLSEVEDEEGRIVWPPAHVPRPPERGLPGVVVWYVVGERDSVEGIAISNAEIQKRVDQSCSLVIILVLAAIAVAASALVYLLVLGPQ